MQSAPEREILRRIGQYVRRWKRWVLSGVRDVMVDDAFIWPVGNLGLYASHHHHEHDPKTE
jgi:hypothetical protein